MTYAADHGNERLRGTTVTYRVAVKEVRQKLLPELNDAFAERVKPGETLLGLRGAIRADLRRQDEEAARRELEEQLVDALLAVNDIPVPPSLTEQYLAAGLKDQRTSERAARAPQRRRGGRPLPRVDAAARRADHPHHLPARRGAPAGGAGGDGGGGRRPDRGDRPRVWLRPEKYRAYADQGPERERIGRTLEERRAFDFLISRAAVTETPAAEAEGA